MANSKTPVLGFGSELALNHATFLQCVCLEKHFTPTTQKHAYPNATSTAAPAERDANPNCRVNLKTPTAIDQQQHVLCCASNTEKQTRNRPSQKNKIANLEPRHVLLVVPPRLPLQLARREVLLVAPLLVVEDEEQGVRVEFLEHVRLLEGSGGLCREGRRRPVGIAWDVPFFHTKAKTHTSRLV